MLWKCCTQHARKFGKLSSGQRTEKGQFSSQSQRKAMPRNAQILHNCSHLTCYQNNVQNSPRQSSIIMNGELPDVQAGFRKDKRTRDQIANIHLIIEGAREFQKNIYMSKPLIMWVTTNCEKFSKGWEYQTTLPASWEICMWVKKQQLELDIEQQTGSKSGKEYVKAVYCHSAYITCRIHHAKCQAGWSTSRNQDFQEKYQ